MERKQILIAAGIAVGAIAGTTLATLAYFNNKQAPSAQNPSPEPSAVIATTPSVAPTTPTAEIPSVSPTTGLPLGTTPTTGLPSGTTPTTGLPSGTTPATGIPSSATSTTKTTPSTTSTTKTTSSTTPGSKTTTQQTQTGKNQLPASEFSQFRQRLLDAIKRRDEKFVRSLVTPETQGRNGSKLSLESFKIESDRSQFWAYMDKAVSVGCGIEPQANATNKEPGSDIWLCPALGNLKQSTQPEKSTLAIIGKNVNVRSEPGGGGKVVGVVSNEFIALDQKTLKSLSEKRQKSIKENAVDGWTPVQLQNGKSGWVLNRYVYNEATDYRVSFVRSQGQWRLRYFAPGNGI